jgi:hypothetical protein
MNTPERLMLQANKKTRKQVELATQLLKSLAGKSRVKTSDGADIFVTRPCLNDSKYSPAQGEFFLALRTYRRRLNALKYNEMLETFEWKDSLLAGDLFSTMAEGVLAYQQMKLRSNVLVEVVKVKDVMRLVYEVKMEGQQFVNLRAKCYWYPKVYELEPYQFDNKKKADLELDRLREKLRKDYESSLANLKKIELPQ